MHVSKLTHWRAGTPIGGLGSKATSAYKPPEENTDKDMPHAPRKDQPQHDRDIYRG
ncbi:hypothetical protein OE810_09890 [Rhodobacteraceae bacterium XHP0102]|nr:hypothetical protein [Rhodobacteraceae bacterium XHP0102]